MGCLGDNVARSLAVGMLVPVLSSCGVLASSSADGDSSGQNYGACPSGTHLECLAVSSRDDVVCDATTLRCRTGAVSIDQRPRLPGYIGRPLHPVARDQHMAEGQNEETPTSELSPKPYYLDDIHAINADAESGNIDGDTWEARATVAYRHLLADQFALPLIQLLSAEIATTQTELENNSNSQSYLQDLATAVSSQYQRLEQQDQKLEPLRTVMAQIDGSVLSLKTCMEVFQRDDTGIALADPVVETCVRTYLQLIPEFRRLNAQDLVDPSWLDALEKFVYGLAMRAGSVQVSEGWVSRQAEAITYAQVQELPITMLALYDTLVTPEIEAQALFPHLRMPIDLEVKGVDGIETRVAIPLGQWARVALQGVPGITVTPQEQLGWFYQAFKKALQQLLDNQQTAIEILTDGSIEASDLWQLALMMEQSGLMELYGGYDSTTTAPTGFQRIHDTLMARIEKQKLKHEGLSLGFSVLCVASALALSPVNFVTAAACGMGTAFSVDTAFQLGGLAAMAETLTYVGISDSLVPRVESMRIRRDANVMALLAILDVVFGAVDMLGSAQNHVYIVREAVDGVRMRWRPFHLAQGTRGVRILDNTDDVLHALRADDRVFEMLVGNRVVRLYPSSGSVHRVDALEAVFEEPTVGSLMAESVRRWGMPHFGFRRAMPFNREFEITGRGSFFEFGIYEIKNGIVSHTPSAPSFITLSDHNVVPSMSSYDVTLQEELLHYLDSIMGPTQSTLLLRGIQTEGKAPLLPESALPIIEELATKYGIDSSMLYASAKAFLTEVRADRVVRVTAPFGSEALEVREAVAVAPEWLVRHIRSLRVNMAGSYKNIPYVNVWISLLDAPNRNELLNGLFPSYLWQDISKRVFWGLPE